MAATYYPISQIKPLNLTVGLRMIGYRKDVFDTQDATHILEDPQAELLRVTGTGGP